MNTAVIILVAFWLYGTSICLDDYTFYPFYPYPSLNNKMCQVDDRVFQDNVTSALMCAALCNNNPSCASLFFKTETRLCTGSNSLYTDPASMLDDPGTIHYADEDDKSIQGWDYFQGGYYKLFTEAKEPAEAHALCTELNGYLVKVDSADENNFLKGMMEAANVDQVAIGLTDQLEEGDFRWMVDGSSPVYANFDPARSTQYGDFHDCVCIVENSNYQWHDIVCTYVPYNYICERNPL